MSRDGSTRRPFDWTGLLKAAGAKTPAHLYDTAPMGEAKIELDFFRGKNMSKGRRVYLQGKCYLKHVSYLKQMLNSPKGTPRCTALCVNGACGLPDWSVKAEKGFEVVSARSDIPYTVEDIRASLMQIASCAPSMTLLVHLGNDWDKIGCIATVRVRGRMVDVLPPMMDKKEEPEKLPADFDLKTLFFPIKK